MSENLAGCELDVAVAKKRGWTDIEKAISPMHHIYGTPPKGHPCYGGVGQTVDSYHSDLNECFRDIVPELIKGGYVLRLETNEADHRATVLSDITPIMSGYTGANPATAICLAYLAMEDE